MFSRPSRIEIDLNRLEKNIEAIRKHIPEKTKIIAIVKSNAYSMGDVEIVRHLVELGISNFAVAATSEGIRIRREFKDIEILVLGYTPEYLYESSTRNNLTLTVYSYDAAKKINEISNKIGMDTNVQIKLDTGMNRLGFKTTGESLEEISKISKLSNIKITGIFSHFADSEENKEFTEKQFNDYITFTKKLEEMGIELGMKHINNTGGVFLHPEYSLDAVRPGIALYGTHDGRKEDAIDFGLEFIADIKSEVAHVKTIQPGESVSYGLIFKADKPTKIATIPIGYSDGILRAMSGKIDVLIQGKRCRQVGVICMDQLMVDVTGVDCNVGDEVVLVGEQGCEKIWINEYSEAADECNTPFLTHLSPRLCRVYIKDGNIVKSTDEILN